MNLYRETVQGYNVKRIERLTMSLSVRVKQFSVGEGDICTKHRPEAIAPCLDLRQIVGFFLLFIIFINKINVAYCFRIYSLYLYEQYFNILFSISEECIIQDKIECCHTHKYSKLNCFSHCRFNYLMRMKKELS